jgi:hypothetical protein
MLRFGDAELLFDRGNVNFTKAIRRQGDRLKIAQSLKLLFPFFQLVLGVWPLGGRVADLVFDLMTTTRTNSETVEQQTKESGNTPDMLFETGHLVWSEMAPTGPTLVAQPALLQNAFEKLDRIIECVELPDAQVKIFVFVSRGVAIGWHSEQHR